MQSIQVFHCISIYFLSEFIMMSLRPLMKIMLLFCTLLLPLCGQAQLHHSHRHGLQANGQQDFFSHTLSLQGIIADMKRSATTGVLVRSLQSNKVLYAENADQLFAPASNMKIITAFAGLKFLGPNFVYRTRLLTDAPSATPVDGVLQGNLYLKYDGDPSLGFADLNALFASLAAQKIQRIQGNLYVDTSRYDKQGVSPGTVASDLGYCYGAPVSGAILNHNCLPVKLFPGSPGGPARLAFPYDVSLPVTNNVVTGSRGMSHLSIQHDAQGHYVLNGSIPLRRSGITLTIPIPCDAQYGEAAAAKLLARTGVQVTGADIPTQPTAQLKLIAQHDSKPLSDLVLEMMKKSDNLIANAVFKSVGAAATQHTASWESSGAAVRAILQKNGVDTQGMVIVDGSGLSRNNQVSPAQLVQILTVASKDPMIAKVYEEALPVGGLDGTLKHRLSTQDIIGKVKAKTGSMHGVSSLSGYVEAHDGEVLVFSIIMNDFAGGLYRYRTLEDNFCRVLRASY